jgi:hypothetical protein
MEKPIYLKTTQLDDGSIHKEHPGGDKYWYDKENRYHRIDGPAVELANGYKEWCFNGLTHRENGPAQEYPNGDRIWVFEGCFHRLDGPAFEYAIGNKCWYYYGERIECQSQSEFERLIKLKAFW